MPSRLSTAPADICQEKCSANMRSNTDRSKNKCQYPYSLWLCEVWEYRVERATIRRHSSIHLQSAPLQGAPEIIHKLTFHKILSQSFLLLTEICQAASVAAWLVIPDHGLLRAPVAPAANEEGRMTAEPVHTCACMAEVMWERLGELAGCC